MADQSRIDDTEPASRTGLTRRTLLGSGLLLGGSVAAAGPAAATVRTGAGVDSRRTALHRFTGPVAWRRGTATGLQPGGAGLVLGRGTHVRSYADPHVAGSAVDYDEGVWTSPWIDNGWGLTELVASWEATTPAGTWIEVCARGRTAAGAQGQWFVMGRWCARDPEQGGAIFRTSLDDQGDDSATVWTDTLHLDGVSYDHLQLRVSLLRRRGLHDSPRVRALSAVASVIPAGEPAVTSTPVLPRARVLPVPPYSQELHRGQYPQWDNGGEAWCSATSSAMILAYWHSGPSARDLSWVEPMQDPQVAFAARNTYDYQYEGCGNWPFNTAYMASFGLASYVTRLRSLNDAERYIAAGIPLATSLSFKSAQLDGAGYSTSGHLMVLAGFDAHGNPVMNDPASHLVADDARVRVTYRRDQFERRWLASSGTVYVAGPRGLVDRV